MPHTLSLASPPGLLPGPPAAARLARGRSPDKEPTAIKHAALWRRMDASRSAGVEGAGARRAAVRMAVAAVVRSCNGWGW